MIAADKQELESRLKQVTLQIREKEISVFTDNFAVLSTQSAFLTGLGFGGLTMVPTWSNDKRVTEVIFYTLVSISIGFNILTLCISSWCMIFGPGLAIRGPDGSMSRAVEGMYAERKWALRFFWVGLFFIMLSGISLGWLKFQNKTAITMTFIFVVFIFVFFAYVKYITRPRFRFPKDARRKPGEFKVGGYDPETGKYADTTGGVAALENPQQKAVQEIESLRQRGILTDDEARAKISLIRAQVEAAEIANPSGSRSLRNRMFGSGGSSSGSGGHVPMSPTSVRMSTDSQSSLGVGLVDKQEVGSSSGRDVIAGMLVRDGKLHRFALSQRGVLIQSPLNGAGANKEWLLAGQQISVAPDSKPNSTTFVLTYGKNKMKLGANSYDEMIAWMDALNRTGLM